MEKVNCHEKLKETVYSIPQSLLSCWDTVSIISFPLLIPTFPCKYNVAKLKVVPYVRKHATLNWQKEGRGVCAKELVFCHCI